MVNSLFLRTLNKLLKKQSKIVMVRRFVSVWLLVATPSWLAFAQSTASDAARDSCRAFVQKFYDWYVPRALKNTREPASNVAFGEKQDAFSRELSHALKRDWDAQRKVQGELVGLDFDPFLDAQDPRDRYVVGTADINRGYCRTEIYAVESGKREVRPSVVAELKSNGYRWQFVNFNYSEERSSTNRDLLTVLRTLDGDRHRQSGEGD